MSRPENYDRTYASRKMTEGELVECRHWVSSLLLSVGLSQDFSGTQNYFSRTFCNLVAFKYRGKRKQIAKRTYPRILAAQIVISVF